MFNINDRNQMMKQSTAITYYSVWDSLPFGNWPFHRNMVQVMNLKGVLAAFSSEAVTFLRTDPRYCTKFWEPLVPGGKRKSTRNAIDSFQIHMDNLVKLCQRFIKIWHEHILKRYVSFTNFPRMIGIYTKF